jgi:plastocyanin
MRKMLIAVAIVALVAGGCGKSSKKSSGGTTGTTTGGVAAGTSTTSPAAAALSGPVNEHGTMSLTGGTLDIEQDNFYFAPTFVNATAGAKASVKLTNKGTAAHTFTIDSLSVDQVVQPGQSAILSLVLPAGGTVAWYCRFHRTQGMQGAFVLPGSSGSGPATTPPTASPQGGYNY